jgi:hypothetical protein
MQMQTASKAEQAEQAVASRESRQRTERGSAEGAGILLIEGSF